MSKGTDRKTLRVPPAVEAETIETILRRNLYSKRPAWRWTSFILTAVREKFDKMRRSRAHRRK